MRPTEQTRAVPARGRTGRLRRPWRFAAAGLALSIALAGLWLASHLRPQHHSFVDRRGVVLSATAEPPTPTADGFVTQAVRLTVDSGLVVDFRVLRPAAATGPLPLVVLLGGFRTGRDAVDVLGDPGNMAVAALDYPYQGQERLRGVWQSIRNVPAMQRGLLDAPPAISVALDWLMAQTWVDRTRVELMGVSLGVPFAAVAGALDSRFRRVWLVHGSAGNREWIANRLESRIPNPHARAASAGLIHLLAHGASFRTDEWAARIAPRTTIVIGAAADEQMAAENVEHLYAAAGEPKELLWSEGGHVRPHDVAIVRQLLAMVRARIGE